MSYQVMSSPIMSCPIKSCRLLSCHVLSSHVVSYPVRSCPILSYHILSYHVLLCPVPFLLSSFTLLFCSLLSSPLSYFPFITQFDCIIQYLFHQINDTVSINLSNESRLIFLIWNLDPRSRQEYEKLNSTGAATRPRSASAGRPVGGSAHRPLSAYAGRR